MDDSIRDALPQDLLHLAEQFPSAVPFLNYRFLVAVRNRQITAFLAWRELVPEEAEILQLETAVPFRREGLARKLLQQLKKQHGGSLFLEVRVSNAPARQLYDSEEFICLVIREGYYTDPYEDAIVLKFHPC